MNFEIIPAIISENEEELEASIKKAEQVAVTAQIDIMDGEFVENKSNWFAFNRPNTAMKLEAHLMVNDPYAWTEKNYDKVDLILSPIETTKYPDKMISLVKSKGKKVGFVLNPKTHIDTVSGFLGKIDQILVMTVVPGRYGAPFVPETLDKVRHLRESAPDLDIEVDGGISPETIGLAKKAGANLFVCGSYIMKSEDPKKAMDNLKKIIEG